MIGVLREYISRTARERHAIGHFNFSTLEGLWAIFRAAQKLGVPVIVGLSEGERKFVGVRQAAALVQSLRAEFDHPIFLNADHTYTFERVKEAVEAGFDAVIFDGAKLSFEENIEVTKKCVEYVRSINPEILVEGELGYIGESSRLLDEIPAGAGELTVPETAAQFVRETGVDLLAPAVGSIHGMLKNVPNPRLNIERVGAIREAAGVPLVLHGASGHRADDVRAAIEAGVAIVHINTELRLAWRDGLKLTLQQNPEEVAPYKILKAAASAMEKLAEEKLRLFNGV